MTSDKLKDLLEKRFGATVRCSLASGMWIIEVILPTLDKIDRLDFLAEIRDIVATNSPKNPKIWKVLSYSNSRQRFNVDGILKTGEPTGSRWGRTIPLMALDCCLWLTEYDGEVLRFGDGISGRTVFAIESTNTAGEPILPFQDQKYLYLETLGQTFSVARVTPDQKQVLKELEIKLK